MSNEKPLTPAENKARIDKALAAGKTVYLRGGKKLRAKKADVAGAAKAPAAPAAKADEGKDTAKANEGKAK